METAIEDTTQAAGDNTSIKRTYKWLRRQRRFGGRGGGSDHDASKIDTGETVEHGEDLGVGWLCDAEVQAGGEQEGEKVEIEEKGRPACRI